MYAQEKLELKIICSDKGNEALKELIRPSAEFSNQAALKEYLKVDCLQMLWSKGFLSASVDTLLQSGTQYTAELFLGEQYQWGHLSVDTSLSNILSIKAEKLIPGQESLLKPSSIVSLASNYLDFLEENGYPFASIRLDSSYWKEKRLYAKVKIDKGPQYKIDSIRVDARMHINPSFLTRYLGIQQDQLYKRSILQSVSKRLEDLGYVREFKPWDLGLYGSGATLNLYLSPQKSNRFDLLLGLMPSNPLLDGKTQFTGDGNIELNNAFGNGEHLVLNWQQLQIKSPRLHLNFERPFVFKSNVGVNIDFNLLKKDSSYLNLFTSLGVQYKLDQRQLICLQLKQQLSNVLTVDTQSVKSTKSLESYLDINNAQLAIQWNWRSTDDRWNPVEGTEWSVEASSGLKKIRKQQAILSIKEDANGRPYDFSKLYDEIPLSSVQSNFRLQLNRFNKLNKYSTIRTGINAGWMYGKKIYLNEMYQIGGIKSLRGFDEESIFASSFAIGTIEYRYLLDKDSNIFGFMDAALVQKNLIGIKQNRQLLGLGLGMNFMTKSGLFTIAYAIGRTDEQSFELKSSKIHLGFSTMF